MAAEAQVKLEAKVCTGTVSAASTTVRTAENEQLQAIAAAQAA